MINRLSSTVANKYTVANQKNHKVMPIAMAILALLAAVEPNVAAQLTSRLAVDDGGNVAKAEQHIVNC